MSNRNTLLFLGSVAAGIGIVYFLTRGRIVLKKFAVTIEATPGGTTDPAPGTYTYDQETMLTVTATPFEGYEFKGWFLNGEFETANYSFSFTVSGQDLLIASFQEIGAPIFIPAFIKPIQNAVAEDWWKTWIETGVYNLVPSQWLRLGHDFYQVGFVKFKIADKAGNGVPDQQLAVYSDPQPDPTDFGHVLLNEQVHTQDNPLILTSNSLGVVAAKVTYKWIEPNSTYKNTIGQGGRARWIWKFASIIVDSGWLSPIEDGAMVSLPYWWDSFERLKNPIYRTLNLIHAYWVDNPNLTVLGDAVADCMVKIEGSKKY